MGKDTVLWRVLIAGSKSKLMAAKIRGGPGAVVGSPGASATETRPENEATIPTEAVCVCQSLLLLFFFPQQASSLEYKIRMEG